MGIKVNKIRKVLERAAKNETLIAGALMEGICPIDRDYDNPTKPCPAGRCAVGELLFRAGVSDKRLLRYGGTEASHNTAFSRILEKEYGLTPSITIAIELVNDSDDVTTFMGRYKNVMEFVEFVQNDAGVAGEALVERWRNPQ